MFQIFNITVITMCIRHSYWSFRICMGILHRGPFSSGGVAVVGRGAPQLHQLGDKWARPPRRAELRLRLPTGTLCWRLQMGQSQGHAGNIAVYMRKRSHLINLLGQYCLFYVSVMWDQCSKSRARGNELCQQDYMQIPTLALTFQCSEITYACKFDIICTSRPWPYPCLVP